jgi:UDP-N-acetylmuramoyl-L-alanyl-D-glutamate--2,6-diaminopimelate ligase
MKLSGLLEGVTVSKMFQTVFGQMVVTHEVEIKHIQYDSRLVERDDIFIALRGSNFEGHRFIDDAVHRGAKVVVVEDDAARPDSYFMHAGVIKVVVPNTRIALARMSANYHGCPSKKLRVVGVTGTNGKTTTAFLLASILEDAGLVGTIQYRIGDEVLPATHTTPESLELQEILARMAARGCGAVAMEVSSHALDQHRVEAVDFSAAIFTNLTEDHLDYHATMENYFLAKKKLFDGLDQAAVAVTNVDDPYGARIVSSTRAKKLTFGIREQANIRAENIGLGPERTTLDIIHEGRSIPIQSSLIGRFNVYNILGAFGAGIGMGIDEDTLRTKIEAFTTVPGRFERISSSRGFTVIVDYAHTPDALKNCLEAVHDILGGRSRKGRIITVFGCGGNRDRGKRPKMGAIASELSDITIVTSDNPREEDPEAIIDEVIAGVRAGASVAREGNRRKAIEDALSWARSGDVVVIAGKGHESYQVIGKEKIPFSDQEVVHEILGGS